ncbi:hypothetical protein Zmor_024462 [Zophobas morio]|uniref:Uncharacterized protein n=1 Tax=Zophobas morio TaxID=2755281 RepID=A0AA38I383_9CUCU|nr:hypothetical protein Zmor_024462 [Zophobas morio]
MDFVLQESEEIIEDTLQVEVFHHVIANKIILFKTDLEDLSSLLGLPLIPRTVSYGNQAVTAGVGANDTIAYVHSGYQDVVNEETTIYICS